MARQQDGAAPMWFLAAMTVMPVLPRRVLVLAYAGRSYTQIACALGLSYEVVRGAGHQALSFLRSARS